MTEQVPPHFHKTDRISEVDIIPDANRVSVVPDWEAPEGTEVTYLNGDTYRRYKMVDGVWRVPGFAGTRTWIGTPSLLEHQATNLTNTNGLGLVILRDGQADAFSGSAQVPTGASAIGSIQVVFLNEVGTSDLVLSADMSMIDMDSLQASQHTDGDLDRVYPTGTINGWWDSVTVHADAYDTLPALSEGDVVNVRITRKGADALDTYNVDLKVAGLYITFD